MAKTTSSDKTTSAASPPANFEAALRELEAIVEAMEKGNLDLDPSLDAYQRGMELLKFCQDKLTAAEQKVRVFDQGVLTEINLGETELPDAE